MKLGSIKQIIIYVESMKSQVLFYQDVLGLEIVYPIIEDYSNEFWVQFKSGECSLCLHGGGTRNFGVDAPKFTFEVSNMDKIREEMRNKGVEISDIREPAPGKKVFNIKDPEGNGLSFEYFE